MAGGIGGHTYSCIEAHRSGNEPGCSCYIHPGATVPHPFPAPTPAVCPPVEANVAAASRCDSCSEWEPVVLLNGLGQCLK